MKSLKKLTSLFVALTMIAAMFTNVAFAQDVTFSDVAQDNAHYQAIYNLVSRGVINGYEDGTFKPDNTITRAEFAKVIMVSELGDANISASLVANFSDTNGHWANKYIAAAVNAGIINGYPEGTFKPDNTVTYAEAVKMVVCALGYGPVIDTTLDPWYADYIKQASSIGATKNAVTAADNGASRGLVAQLIDNMDDCQRLVQAGTDASGNPKYVFDDEWSNDEVTDEYGVLVGVYENSLIGSASTLTKSQIQIDNSIYTLDDGVDYTSLERYIGYNVDFKIRRTSGNKIYVSGIVANNGTTVVTLDADYIEAYSGNTLSYFIDDEFYETDDYKIDDNLYVIYNGYGVPQSYIDSSFKQDIFDIDAGSVTLYNNDGDSAMDVAIVEKYETYFVNTVSKSTKEGTVTITDKLGLQPQIVFDEDYVKVTKVTTAGGDETSALITSIAKNHIVSVAEPHSSAPTDVPTIVKISTATVSGTVDKMQGDYEIITLKSKDYVLAECFKTYLGTDDNESTYGFDVGSSVKFFLDYAGRIVCTDVTEKSASYGYLIDCLAGTGMNENQVEVRILTTSNSLKTFSLSSNVSINGGSSISPSAAITELRASSAIINANKADEYKAEAGSIEQVITYETNNSGEINKIGTIGTGTDGTIKPYAFTTDSSLEKTNFADCDTKLPYSESVSTFKSADSEAQTQFTLDSGSIVFYVPYGRLDVNDYKKYTKGQFDDDSYYVEPYERDGTGRVADVVVWYGDDGDDTADITVKSPTVMVKSIDRNMSSGEEYRVLKYVTIGSTDEKTAVCETQSILSGVEAGDIIRIALNGSELDAVALVYDASEGELYNADGDVVDDGYISQTQGSDTLYYQAQVGIVYDKPEEETGTIEIAANAEGDESHGYAVNSSTKYYRFDDTDNNTPIKTDDNIDSLSKYLDNPDDVTAATKVFIVAIETYVTGIYVID